MSGTEWQLTKSLLYLEEGRVSYFCASIIWVVILTGAYRRCLADSRVRIANVLCVHRVFNLRYVRQSKLLSKLTVVALGMREPDVSR